MKKYISVIIGVLIGAIFSVGMIYANEGRVAHGEINAWDKLVVGAENLKWEDTKMCNTCGCRSKKKTKKKTTKKKAKKKKK